MAWEKVEHAKALIEKAVRGYERIAVACSFGKDSMVTVHLAREVKPDISIFSVMTPLKPHATIEYLNRMNVQMGLDVVVYIVGLDGEDPSSYGIDAKIRILPATEFCRVRDLEEFKGDVVRPIYEVNPDVCCQLLKVEPMKVAVRDLDAWICGLRNTEGATRVDFEEVEERGGLVKINPILAFTEADLWRYMATRGIEPHPWYGNGYRSLGCEPCSRPGGETERSGRWFGTDKAGGECGIHTQSLR